MKRPPQKAWSRISDYYALFAVTEVLTLVLNNPLFGGILGAFGMLFAARHRDAQRVMAGAFVVSIINLGLDRFVMSEYPRYSPALRMGHYVDTLVLFSVSFWGFLFATAYSARRKYAGLFLVPIVDSIFVSLFFGYSWLTDVVGAVLLGSAMIIISILVLGGALQSLQRD